MKLKDAVGAASATYRKAVNKVADVLRIDPSHSRYPSEDFEEISDQIDVASRKRLLKWYRMGLRKGFAEATDAMVTGTLKYRDGTLYCPSKVVISVEIKFRGVPWQEKEFTFTAKELGFK